MKTKMLINAVESEEYRVAIVTDNVLDGFYIESSSAEQKTGNIYKGLIERIEPSLQACFVNFGADKNGFLPSGDIHPEYYHIPFDPATDGPLPPLEKVLKKGQEVLVQVTKEMPGRKGAHLTTYISLAGRYLVLTPGKETGGVSKKIEDEKERARLKSIMAEFTLPEGVGFIVRTAALKQNKRELSRDLNRLLRMWENIKKAGKESDPLILIHKEQDVGLRTLRDYFTGEITEVLVDDKDTFNDVKSYMKIISPAHQNRVKLYKDKRPIFDQYKVEEQIEAIYRSEVRLKSGGYIVIDQTEALISIDVNSGRGKSGKDIESTAFKTNTEAAAEIARQLRLRDMGGLVVIDFIDMRDKKHNRDVEKTLREEIKKDRAKIDVAHISKFGLLELSRQRLRPSIESRSYQPCHFCQGRGIIMSVESAALSFLRQISLGVTTKDVSLVRGVLALDVATYLQNRKRRELSELETRYEVSINLKGDPLLPPGSGQLEFLPDHQGKEGQPA